MDKHFSDLPCFIEDGAQTDLRRTSILHSIRPGMIEDLRQGNGTAPAKKNALNTSGIFLLASDQFSSKLG